jgi:hypothetical protein
VIDPRVAGASSVFKVDAVSDEQKAGRKAKLREVQEALRRAASKSSPGLTGVRPPVGRFN